MRRFEFSEGTSNKFWEIDYSGGDSFTVRWGKIGTDGQSQTKAFDSSAKAGAAAEKLIAEKVGKGYAEVAGGASTSSSGATSAPSSVARPATGASAASSVARPAAGASAASSGARPASAADRAAAIRAGAAAAKAAKAAEGTGGQAAVQAAQAPAAGASAASSASAQASTPSSGAAAGASAVRSAAAQAATAATAASAVSSATASASAHVAQGATATLAPPQAPGVTFHWTDALRRKIHPWRGQSHPLAKPSTELKKAVSRLAEVAALPAVDLQAKAGRQGAAVTARARQAPDQISDDPKVEATYAALLGFNDMRWPRANEIGADLASVWCVKGGVVYGLRTMIEVFPLDGLAQVTSTHTGWGSVPYTGPWKVMRAHLGAASEKDYDHALEIARAAFAGGDSHLQMMLAYAFPDQPLWAQVAAQAILQESNVVQAGCSLLASVLRPELATQLAERYKNFVGSDFIEVDAGDFLPALVDRLGDDAVPALAAFLDGDTRSAARRTIATALAVIGSCAAAELLLTHWNDKAIAPIVTAYFSSQPYLAALLLTPRACASRDEALHACLKAAIAQNPGEALRALPSLDAPARAWLEAAAGAPTAAPALAPAPAAGELPAILANPPWTRPRPKSRPHTASLQPLDHPDTVVWRQGERKPDGRKPSPFDAAKEEKMLKNLRAKDPGYLSFADHLLELNDSEGALKAWNELPGTTWNPYGLRRDMAAHTVQERYLARYGVACLPGLLKTLSIAPDVTYEALARMDSPQVAATWAEALAGKKYRPLARKWLHEFPRAASVGLIPLALGPTGKARLQAEDALRHVAKAHAEVVVQTAQDYGVKEAIEEMLAFDPLLNLPAKLPSLPAWFTPAMFTHPTLKSGGALPTEALTHIGTMLALSQLEAPYLGLEHVKEACEPRSLADFAWDVFTAWVRAGGPAKEDWGFLALGYLGGDEAARRLAPELRKWPGESLSARAQRGLDVLGAIGTDVALMHLHGIAQKVKYKALQDKARQKIAEIAEGRGLTVDELADRLVPDFDLDEQGTRILSFGARAFRIGFDEALKPFVLDAGGKRLPDLPKPVKTDDAAAAEESTQIWKALKKDVKTVGSLQVDRLEQSMARRRRWDGATFKLFLAGHPLLIHLVRRLVWGVYRDGVTTFRVAEDRTFADVRDDQFHVGDEDVVGLVHPLETDLTPWAQVFADYELAQPFPQLSRPVHRPTPAEAKSEEITRLKGRKYPGARLLKLETRGWHRGDVESGCILDFRKPLAGGRSALLEINEGIYVLEPARDEIGLDVIKIQGGKVSDLDPVEFSEIIQDIEGL